MNMLSIPLSFSNGKGKTLIEGEDEYYETLLTRILKIEPGEFPISIHFGVPDATFSSLAKPTLVELAGQFVPEIQIINIEEETDEVNEGEETISIFYERTE